MKVLIDEIVTALFTADDEVDCYYDKGKHEVFVVADYIEHEMTDDELEEYLDSDDLLRLPNKYEIHEYNMMEKFIDTLSPSCGKGTTFGGYSRKRCFPTV